MKTRTHVRLVPLLIAEFPRWLDYFVERGPFTRREQKDCHLKAIRFDDVVGLPVRSRAGRLRSAISAQRRAGGRRVTRRAGTKWRRRAAA